MNIDGNTRALVIGASGGVGSALADALAGTQLATLSRSEDGFDLTDEARIAAAAADIGPLDLIFDATGGLRIGEHGPEKTIGAIEPTAMAAQFALNAIGPALLLKHFGPKMRRDGPAVFATLSARVGSIGDNRAGGWISYRAAKAALNQIVRTAAIELRRRNRESVVVALHPGTVATPMTQTYLARHPSVPPAEAAANLRAVLERLGPEHTGGFFDYAMEPVPW
ncbi:MAG: SDR family NAD(P)-dependent oxidoreductase [Pseudomonadota bacterium]